MIIISIFPVCFYCIVQLQLISFSLSAEDLKGDNPVEVRYVKFQSVNNLQIFISENQSGSDVTNIESLVLYGSPVSTTNMQDFKRIAGKQGESH